MRFVPAWEVPQEWPHIVEALRKVLKKQTAWDEKSIYNACIAGQMHLWSAEGAVFVTQVQQFPMEKVAVIVLCGGNGMEEWKEDAISAIDQYAKGNGCNAVCVVGRKGWERIYPGLKPNGEIVMRKEL